MHILQETIHTAGRVHSISHYLIRDSRVSTAILGSLLGFSLRLLLVLEGQKYQYFQKLSATVSLWHPSHNICPIVSTLHMTCHSSPDRRICRCVRGVPSIFIEEVKTEVSKNEA